ncbi:MAG: HEAT repeat domain-containing protein, partial [Vitreimonas sp.]
CNPLLLTAARKMRAERELACDEQVVAAGFDAHSYATALIEVARAMHRATPPVLVAMAQPHELERRVGRLLRGDRLAAGDSHLPRILACAAVALVASLAMLTAPAAGLVPDGSVQPGAGSLSGLDDPMSERVPLDYEQLAAQAAAMPAEGPERAVIAALQTQLRRESSGHGDLVRERAIWALVQVRDGRLYEPLAQQVRDRDWRVRAYVAWTFGVAEDRRATPLLVPMLDDPVWRVRAMAGAALANIADRAAADAMIDALDDPAWQVRIAATEYVERIGDRDLAERLRPLLRDPHTATRAHAEAVHSRF